MSYVDLKPSRPALLQLTLLAAALFCAALVHRGCHPSPPSDMDALAARLRAAGLTVAVVSPSVCFAADGPRDFDAMPFPPWPGRDPAGPWRGAVMIERPGGPGGPSPPPWALSGDPDVARRVAGLIGR